MTTKVIPVPLINNNIHIPHNVNSGILYDIDYIQPIEDLSCNSITIRQEPECLGSVEFITTPHNAQILIYDEDQGDYIVQSIVTGSIDSPTQIDNIPCTSITRSNRFRLILPGYVDVEGILPVISESIYTLNIVMEPLIVDICNWIISKGGWTNLTTFDIMTLIGAYLGQTNLGFTVTIGHIMGGIAYYLNNPSSGNSLTKCAFT